MLKEKKALDFAAGKLGVKLKGKQSETVLAFLSGHDVFVSLPTGYGNLSYTEFCQLYLII